MKWYKKLPRTTTGYVIFSGIVIFILLFAYHLIYVRPVWEWLRATYDFSEKLPYTLYTNLITAVGSLYGLFALALTILTFFGVKKLGNLEELQDDLRKKLFLVEAELLYEREKNDEAWEMIQQIPDDDWEVCLYKGLIKFRFNDTNDALAYYSKSFAFENCDKSEVYLNRGRIYIKLAESAKNKDAKDELYKLAIKDFEMTIGLKNHIGAAYNKKAYVERRLFDEKTALRTLETGIEIDKTCPELYYNKACYLSLSGKSKEAVEALDEAIRLKPALRNDAIIDPDFQKIVHLKEFKKLILCLPLQEYPTNLTNINI